MIAVRGNIRGGRWDGEKENRERGEGEDCEIGQVKELT